MSADEFDYQPEPSLFWWAPGAVGLLSSLFWLWMFVDCYRRRNGFDAWHLIFLFFPPSVVPYFILHVGQIFGRGGGGFSFFGLGLKERIRRAQQNLRISDTLAARAELGELFFENKQYDECEAEFQHVLSREPDNLEAIYHVALCRLKKNDFPAALAGLEKVMARERKLRFGKAWLYYTEALVANGRTADALEERRKLSRAFPRPLTEYAYAELLAQSGDKAKAKTVLEDMLATSEQAPSEDRQWLSKGRSLLRSV